LVVLDTKITLSGLRRLEERLSSNCLIIHDSGSVRGRADAGLDLANSGRPGWSWRASR
jgi:hypothetical protein